MTTHRTACRVLLITFAALFVGGCAAGEARSPQSARQLRDRDSDRTQGAAAYAPAMAVNVQDTPDAHNELAVQGPLAFNLGTLAAGASQTVSIKASASAAGLRAF